MDIERRRELARARARVWRERHPGAAAAAKKRYLATAKGRATVEAWKAAKRAGRPPGNPRGGKVAAIKCACGVVLSRKRLHARSARCSRCWSKITRDRNTAIIRREKDKPCADCGRRYPPYVMDFDHRGDKRKAVSRMHQTGMRSLLAEIAKCDVVCSNCHRERTHRITIGRIQ